MKIGLILLAILKGIGIVLLALLLLFLLLILVVLLSPIKYRLQGEKQAALGGSFAVSYLWGAIRLEGSHTAEGKKLRLKVLWFTLMGGEEKPKKAKKSKKTKKPKQTKQAPKPEPKPDLQAAEKTQPKPEPPKPEPKPEQPKPEQPKPAPQRMEQKQPKTVRRVKLSEIAEKPPMEDAALSLEEEAFFTGEDAAQEAEQNGKLPPIVRELWHLEQKKEIGKALAKLLKRLMKGILPGNLFLKATLGTGEPATTGYLLALAGILTAKFGNDIQIKGDFTKITAEDIEVRVKGKIVLGKLLFAVLAFLLTKPVRKAVRNMITFLRNKDAA